MQSLAALATIAALTFVAVQGAPTTALGTVHGECRKPLTAPGQPSRLRSLAQLNAMRDWVRQAGAIDQRYGLWHNAADRQVDCQELPNSLLIRCIATAKPCAGTSPDPAQEARN